MALLGAVGVAAHTLSGSPLGLAVAGLVSTGQLLEALERRRAIDGYGGRSSSGPSAPSGWTAALEDGDRLPVSGRVKNGVGSQVDRDALPRPIGPGSELPSGARVFGGPFVVESDRSESTRRRARCPDSDGGRFALWAEAVALAAAGLALAATRSPSRALGVLLLLSSRTEIIGREAADGGARRRVMRSGALPLRDGMSIRRPDVVLIDCPRILSDGLEVARTDLPGSSPITEQAIDLGSSVAVLAGSPWGPIHWPTTSYHEGEGSFDGHAAHAAIDGYSCTLKPTRRSCGVRSLELTIDGDLVAVIGLRPRLAADAARLATTCRLLRVELALADQGATSSTRRLAREAGITVLRGPPAELVRRAAGLNQRVVLVTDAGCDGGVLEPPDLTIGLGMSPTEPSAQAVDLVVPDLATCAAVLESGAARDAAARDALLLSRLANGLGAGWIAARAPRHRAAATLPNLATTAGLFLAWLRLRGGSPPQATALRLADPRPERWGRQAVDEVLRALASEERGLSDVEAAVRIGVRAPERRPAGVASSLYRQLRSPLTGVLAVGAGLSLATGVVADVVLISAVIALNAVLGAVQERQAGEAAAELERMGQVTARVLREGRRVPVSAAEVVPGDVLLLASGERVAADARVLRARGLEVNEASLTGESFPVVKRAEGGSPEARVVLEGTDVTVGSGRAVVFAVGPATRFGATAEALRGTGVDDSPLDRRLHRMLLEILPVVVGGGIAVVLAGILWRRALPAQLALGAGTAIAAVPEGLPLLSSLGEAAVAKRLVSRRALVRRLAAVESLGRVDVACVDKTGTLTENRLSLQIVVGPTGARGKPTSLAAPLRHVLRCAALASPRPGSSAGAAHATDVAVVEGARRAGLAAGLDDPRDREIPFDASRPFHGAVVGGRLYVKGSVEELVPRCTHVRREDRDSILDDGGRQDLLDVGHALADEGLRVLMVAEGSAETSDADPDGLLALGFLGIGDSVRPGIAEAVRDCREAGIRLIMLTGDHPATARAIAREIGLLDGGGVLTGPEIEALSGDELATALERASVVARIAPLEKLRIVEALRRRGHVVAMTGDGVNDAPALRLADVGVAMGRSGTEVARQAADLVLVDDQLPVLVDALIEGRTFWANLRRALAMLLGGNLGEVAFIVTLAGAGFASPMTARQVLAVNLVSDVLPAFSLVVQSPEHRDLSRLAREGDATLGEPLRGEIVVRALATATPAVVAYLLGRMLLGPSRAQSIGFASIVLTQLTQTLDASRTAGRGGQAAVFAVGGSTAFLAAALHLRPLQSFLRLETPGILGWSLISAAGVAAPAMSRALGENGSTPRRLTLSAVPGAAG